MRDARRREVKAAANQLLAEVSFDFAGPVDVFDVVRRLGLWLIFRPLQNALGATLRVGSGGIIITTQREPKIQRFTAAHELAHWRLHRGDLEWDTPDAVLSPGGINEREREAQLFASHLLMPRRLVRRALHAVDVTDAADITPLDLYSLSRELQVSYEAAARQLQNLGIVTTDRVSALLKHRPLALKTRLNAGVPPRNARADVWPALTPAQHFLTLPEDEIVIQLPENALAGYRWRTLLASDAAEIALSQPAAVADREQPALTARDETVVGGVGRRTVIVRTKAPGDWTLALELARSFDSSAPIDRLAFSGTVDAPPARANSVGVLSQLLPADAR